MQQADQGKDSLAGVLTKHQNIDNKLLSFGGYRHSLKKESRNVGYEFAADGYWV